MKNTLFALIVVLQQFIAISQTMPQAFEENERWGYKNQEKIVIPPRFQLAMEFSEKGIAAVVDSNGWAYINSLGYVILRPFVYDNGPDYFVEGLARFVQDGKMGFFDEWGRIIIKPQFDFAEPFSEGTAFVNNGCYKEHDGEHYRMIGGKWGAVNAKGEIIVALEADEIQKSDDKKIHYTKNGIKQTIDLKENKTNAKNSKNKKNN